MLFETRNSGRQRPGHGPLNPRNRTFRQASQRSQKAPGKRHRLAYSSAQSRALESRAHKAVR